MANYDNRLSEWFKQLERKEKELKEKRQTPEQDPLRPVTTDIQDIERFEVREQASQAPGAVTSSVDAAVLTESAEPPAQEPDIETSTADLLQAPANDGAEAVGASPDSGSLFDEEDVPQVEDFLSFLNRPVQPQPGLFETPQEDDEPEELQAETLPLLDEQSTEVCDEEYVPETISADAALLETTVEQAPEAIIETPQPPEAPEKASNNGGRSATVRAPHLQPGRQIEPPEPPAESEFAFPPGESRLHLVEEGTGEPRPVSELMRVEPETAEAEAAAPHVAEPEPGVVEQELFASEVIVEEPTAEQPEILASEIDEFARQEPAPEPQAAQDISGQTQAQWDRLPHHLQTLFTSGGEEVAQSSYKTFKETRADLIQRLLDPVITLEEAARVLNVCPTTVRRYTNRGTLRHIRTAGNQRRFRLSDVLAFMESTANKPGNGN